MTGDVLARPLRIHGRGSPQPTKDVFGRRMVAHRPGSGPRGGRASASVLYSMGNRTHWSWRSARGDFIEGVEFIDECNGVIKVGLARAEQAHHLVQRDRPRPLHGGRGRDGQGGRRSRTEALRLDGLLPRGELRIAARGRQ